MFLREVINSLMRSNPGAVFSVAKGAAAPPLNGWLARVKDGSVLLRRADVDK